MARGTPAKEGDVHVSANGYQYTRVKAGWKLTHRVLAEKKLGRPLSLGEQAYFIDGDRTNLHPDNIGVRGMKRASIEARLRHIEDQIQGLLDLKSSLEHELATLA